MRERGFALLIVLWSVVLLTTLVTVIVAASRSDAQLAANLQGAAAAEAASDGAVFEAAYRLLEPEAPREDGRPFAMRMDGSSVTLCVRSEAGKLNPNTTAPELLAALLRQLGADTAAAERVATAIFDWRTPGETPSPGGAKTAQYRAAGLDYGPSGGPFESLQEVGAVLGMTPELAVRLQPHLSLYASAEPDPVVADPLVRAAIRAVSGPGALTSPRRPGQQRIVNVTATAETAGGSRFTRRAVLRLNTEGNEPPVRVLAWDAPETGAADICR